MPAPQPGLGCLRITCLLFGEVEEAQRKVAADQGSAGGRYQGRPIFRVLGF